MIRRLAPLSLLLVSACAREAGPFPSLGARAAEGRGFEELAVPPAAAPVADPALDARVAALRTRLDTARAAFDAGVARAAAAAGRARGARAGSEAWIGAQSALADLDSARADTSAVASDGAQAQVDRAATLAAPYPVLEALQDASQAELSRQEGEIARLGAMLAPAG